MRHFMVIQIPYFAHINKWPKLVTPKLPPACQRPSRCAQRHRAPAVGRHWHLEDQLVVDGHDMLWWSMMISDYPWCSMIFDDHSMISFYVFFQWFSDFSLLSMAKETWMKHDVDLRIFFMMFICHFGEPLVNSVFLGCGWNWWNTPGEQRPKRNTIDKWGFTSRNKT